MTDDRRERACEQARRAARLAEYAPHPKQCTNQATLIVKGTRPGVKGAAPVYVCDECACYRGDDDYVLDGRPVIRCEGWAREHRAAALAADP